MNALVSERFVTKSIKNRPIRLSSAHLLRLKNYKKLICNKRAQYYEAKIDEIDESIDQNNFWNFFKKNWKPQIKPISPMQHNLEVLL